MRNFPKSSFFMCSMIHHDADVTKNEDEVRTLKELPINYKPSNAPRLTKVNLDSKNFCSRN